MGTFTLALKKVIEIENGKIGLDDYPIFDEAYRPKLNEKIIRHFWNQEIGQETIDMFRLALSRRMHEIMPLYNQHYVLGLLELDPLSTVNIHTIVGVEANTVSNETGNTTSNETGNSVSDQQVDSSSTENTVNESGTVAKSRAIGSDFPQTMLMDNGDYATNGSDNISDATATGTADMSQTTTGTTNTTADTTTNQVVDNTGNQVVDNTTSQDSKTTGYQGHAPLLIMQARQALVNVDMMVINELQDLFMLIWSNNDSYSGKRFNYYGLY